MEEERIVRCQAAIIQEGKILLVKHLNHTTGNIYWWFPGGGLKPGETKEACVIREVKEEANIDVNVERLLFEYPGKKLHRYQRLATFLCTIIAGAPRAGDEFSQTRSLIGVGWFALHDERAWEPDLFEKHLYPVLARLRVLSKHNRSLIT